MDGDINITPSERVARPSSALAKPPELAHHFKVTGEDLLEAQTNINAAPKRDLAESFATRMLASGVEITQSIMLAGLQLFRVGFSARTNVRPDAATPVRSETLGLCHHPMVGTYISPITRKWPNFTKMTAAYISTLPGAPEAWQYSSISVNHGYAARLHRDKGNEGPSLGCALGHYTGGNLQVWSRAKGLTPSGPMVEHNVREAPALFDGNNLHCVTDFVGDRYSLVYFTSKYAFEARNTTRLQLGRLGIRWGSKFEVRQQLQPNRPVVPPRSCEVDHATKEY